MCCLELLPSSADYATLDGHLSSLGRLSINKRWSPTNPRRVTHQLKDGHPPEGGMQQTCNLALRLNSQDLDQVTTARNGHPSPQGWSPTNPMMDPLQKEVHYRLGIWHLDLTHKMKTR